MDDLPEIHRLPLTDAGIGLKAFPPAGDEASHAISEAATNASDGPYPHTGPQEAPANNPALETAALENAALVNLVPDNLVSDNPGSDTFTQDTFLQDTFLQGNVIPEYVGPASLLGEQLFPNEPVVNGDAPYHARVEATAQKPSTGPQCPSRSAQQAATARGEDATGELEVPSESELAYESEFPYEPDDSDWMETPDEDGDVIDPRQQVEFAQDAPDMEDDHASEFPAGMPPQVAMTGALLPPVVAVADPALKRELAVADRLVDRAEKEPDPVKAVHLVLASRLTKAAIRTSAYGEAAIESGQLHPSDPLPGVNEACKLAAMANIAMENVQRIEKEQREQGKSKQVDPPWELLRTNLQ